VYLSGKDETSEDGTTTCRKLADLEATAKDLYYIKKAYDWIKAYRLPDPPIP
jgi:hypothetical protein